VEKNESIEKEQNDDSEPHKLNTENTNSIGNEPIVELEISKSFIGFVNETICENVVIEQSNPKVENNASIEKEKNDDSEPRKLNI